MPRLRVRIGTVMSHPRAPRIRRKERTKSRRLTPGSYLRTGTRSSAPRPSRAGLFAGGRSAGGHSRALSHRCHAADASSPRTRIDASDPAPHHSVRPRGSARSPRRGTPYWMTKSSYSPPPATAEPDRNESGCGRPVSHGISRFAWRFRGVSWLDPFFTTWYRSGREPYRPCPFERCN